MSTQATNPLYGRYFNLTVKFPPNDNGQQTVLTVADSQAFNQNLRITFDIGTHARQAYWYADFEIYNLDAATSAQLLGNGNQGNAPSGLQQGMEVQFSAGYQYGQQGLIWDGYVIQALFDRQNVTDFKITLHCMVDLINNSRNFLGFSSPAMTAQTNLVQQMAKQCFYPQGVPTLPSAGLNGKPLPRGKVFFGNPTRYFASIAQQNNSLSWLTKSGMNIAALDDKNISAAPAVTFSALPSAIAGVPQNTNKNISYSIIGTPQQTEVGVNLRVLLDPRVQAQNPVQVIAIDTTVITALKRYVTPGAAQFVSLDQGGNYIVLSLRHRGDTRGVPWYTDIVGIQSTLGKAGLLNPVNALLTQSGTNAQ